ncbi:MAG: hypothetical protein KGZ64_10300 [Thermaerobacter sp.]|nr:hypothetical protein [Thermaerobacter sp.]
MPQNKRISVVLRITEDLYTSLKHLAQLNKESVSVLVNRILAQSTEVKQDDADRLTLAMRRVIRDTTKSVENGLAKFASKTAITAATGMYLGVQCAADLGAKEVVALHKKAEAMAQGHIK